MVANDPTVPSLSPKGLHRRRDCITYVGSIMTKTAQNWFLARELSLEKLHVQDTWRNFYEALDERFTDKQKRFSDSRELMALKYEGDIQVFLIEFKWLNDTVGLSG